jgi:crotonobetainyl-CoA:carnitine CoA-transferase CaiB-like acyl-CoA transferase
MMPSTKIERTAGPFSKLLVIDLTHVLNGPFGTTIRPKGSEAVLRGNVVSGKHAQLGFLAEQKSDSVFRILFEWFFPFQKVK